MNRDNIFEMHTDRSLSVVAIGKISLSGESVLPTSKSAPAIFFGDDVDDGNALESTTIAQTKIPDFTSTDASESLLDGATSTIPDISTTEPSISTAPETSSIPDPTSTSSDNLKNGYWIIVT
ncbi:unnamed protein product [Nesidiocoris tenuis]|uniref:Uncharacterized protein n=1 Tax=Nesidiocoris tenuis TaxID=355587 RepID=A0A6H5HDW9_9HEMI|nr:unnamed protein product [Nesidiocoris tenuis]